MVRLSLKYPVSSDIKLSTWEAIRDGDSLIKFMGDHKGRISHIRISVPVTPAKPARDPEIRIERQAPDKLQPTIDDRATQQIEEYVLSIETLLNAFLGRFVVNRAEWKMEWCVDSEEEARSVGKPPAIDACREAATRPDVRASIGEIQKLVVEGTRFRDLIVPLIFWNHGLRDMSEHRYIGAYYSLFFVLEVLLAPGYSSPKKVEDCFLASSVLVEAVDSVRTRSERNVLTAVGLRRLIENAGCEMTTKGIVRFLVKTRDRLHHANSVSPPAHWLPTHDEKFCQEARLLHGIVDIVINTFLRESGH